MRGRTWTMAGGLVVGAVTAVAGGGSPATAATLTVSTGGQLRAAIASANADANITEIVIDTSPIVVTTCLPPPGGVGIHKEDVNGSGDLDFFGPQNLLIRGSLPTRVAITQSCPDRIFDHRGSGELHLRNLDLSSDLPNVPNGPGQMWQDYSGGAIRSTGGSLLLEQVRIHGSSAGDADDEGLGNPNPPGRGGGVYSEGFVLISGSIIEDNAAGRAGDASSIDPADGGHGGGVYAPNDGVSVFLSTIGANRTGVGGDGSGGRSGGRGGTGGGIYAQSVLIEDSIVSGNLTGRGGNSDSARGGDGGNGAGIFASIDLAALRTTFDGNLTGKGGDGDTSNSGGATVQTGGDGGSGAGVMAQGVTAEASRFTANSAGIGGGSGSETGGTGGHGGAIAGVIVDLDDVDLDGNLAGPGGSSAGATGSRGGNGGAVAANSQVTAHEVFAVDNRAGAGGGGTTGGPGGDGGAIGPWNADPAIEIEHSSFDDNLAGDGGLGTGTDGDGGNGGAVATMENAPDAFVATSSSFTRNAVSPGGTGSAIAADNLTMTFVSVLFNSGPIAVDHFPTGSPAAGAVTASLFAANDGVNCDIDTQSGGHNFEQGGNTCVGAIPAATDRVDQGAMGVGPAPQTTSMGKGYVPLENGPLIDSIPVGDCQSGAMAGRTLDQWFRPRPLDGGCEPGALEFDGRLDAATKFVPVAGARVFDTRPDEPGAGPKGKIPPRGTIDVQVWGVGGVPVGAVSVVLNVTATEATARGFVTGWATGEPRPATSNLNVTAPGQTRPNLAIVPIGNGGKVSFYSLSGTHLLADVWGYFVDAGAGQATDGRLETLADPFRAFDTRPDEPGAGPKGKVAAGGQIDVQITGVGGVPTTGVAAVVLNITGTEATARGFVTAWAEGNPRPATSVLNLTEPGATAANLAIVPVGPSGKVSLFSQSGAHLLADITGYITDATAALDSKGLFISRDPERVFDTRAGEPGAGPKGFVGAGTSIDVLVDRSIGLPPDADAIALNLTGTEALRRGFIVGWPAGGPRPLASNLNLAAPGDTRANSAILRIGTDDQVSFYAHTGAHVLADTSGYFLPSLEPPS